MLSDHFNVLQHFSKSERKSNPLVENYQEIHYFFFEGSLQVIDFQLKF